jgi:hypothetical protein
MVPLLFCTSYHGYRTTSRPEGFVVAMARATPKPPSRGNRACPLEGADDFVHRIFSRSACFHHPNSEGQALKGSLVKPGADLSASYLGQQSQAVPASCLWLGRKLALLLKTRVVLRPPKPKEFERAMLTVV